MSYCGYQRASLWYMLDLHYIYYIFLYFIAFFSRLCYHMQVVGRAMLGAAHFVNGTGASGPSGVKDGVECDALKRLSSVVVRFARIFFFGVAYNCMG